MATPPGVGGGDATAGTVIAADPTNYRTLLAGLGPGDTLRLAPGTYTEGLPLDGHHGAEGSCIVVEGPDVWPPTAVFTARDCCNTVSLTDSSYVVVRNLEIDGSAATASVDAVKAESPSTAVHHVTLENLWIHDHDLSQQTVGISTKCPAWNWVVRDSVIETTGTGMYFGNSDGQVEFVGGLVEGNLVLDSVGYDIQIKHQEVRDTATNPEIPTAATTVIRHNVLSKAAGSGTGADARPNLLVGHMPLSGPGSGDGVEIYGNLFWQNETDVEPLIQAEGHVAIYDNLLLDDVAPGIVVRSHNGPVREVRVFHNAIVAGSAATGIRIRDGEDGFTQEAVGNAVYAGTPLWLSDGAVGAENTTGARSDADDDLANPFGDLSGADRLDLTPLVGSGLAGPVDTTGLEGFTEWDRDFDSRIRTTDTRGAYGAEGVEPFWLPALERKALSAIFADGFETGDPGCWSAVVF